MLRELGARNTKQLDQKLLEQNENESGASEDSEDPPQ
jgi:hypothetical protein